MWAVKLQQMQDGRLYIAGIGAGIESLFRKFAGNPYKLHTYMAAEALESAAKAKGWEVPVQRIFRAFIISFAAETAAVVENSPFLE